MQEVQASKHATATVFLLTAEMPRRVLLLRHKKLGVWMPPGGHVEAYENPFQAVLREVREETGLDVRAYFPLARTLDDRAYLLPMPRWILEERVEAHGHEGEHSHVDHVYAVTVPFQAVTHDPMESDGACWIGEDDLKNIDTFENCRILMRELFASCA